MKKVTVVLLSVVMSLSVLCFAGCGETDTQSYIDRIAELEAQLKTGGAEEVISLKAKVSELESTVGSLKSIVESTSSGNAALKTQLDSLNDTIAKLSKQLTEKDTELLNKIAALEQTVKDKQSGNAALEKRIAALEAQNGKDEAALTALKEQLTAGQAEISALKDRILQLETAVGTDNAGLIKQIAELTTLVNETKTSLDAANESLTSLQTQINTLTDELTVSNTRITLLENINSGDAEQHIYTVCEDAAEGQLAADNTFTFVNNGIKLFSVKLTKWIQNGVPYAAVVTFINHNIPSCVPMGSYFSFYAFDVGTDTYYKFNETLSRKLKPGESFTRNMDFLNAPASTNVFIVGLPTQDAAKESILPYATFRLPPA